MKIECSGPNGETFEASDEDFNRGQYYDQDKLLKEQWDRMQKALETWCNAFKVEAGKEKGNG